MAIRVKRVYEKPAGDDGYRVLVDRLWPRGVSKEAAKIDLWLKKIAPTSELRKWFGHDVRKWDQFKSHYFLQLDEHPDVITELLAKAKKGRLTLLFAAKETKHNNAMALKTYLTLRMRDRHCER